jgi:transposase
MAAGAAIDAGMKRAPRASSPPSTILRASGRRDMRAFLGSVPRRNQSGEVGYVGGASKCDDGRGRTLLCGAADVMLTRYRGALKPNDWALAIAKRSMMRKARLTLPRRLAAIMDATLRIRTEFVAA